MAKSEIQSVEVSYFIHATEDEALLTQAVEERLGLEVPPLREELRGHFGNRILRVRYHVTGDDAERLVARIASQLSREEGRAILENIDAMMDEHGALYLRLNKQQILSGRIAFASNDPVRLKVKPRSFLIRGDLRRFFAGVMGLTS